MTISELIDKTDNVELVRNQIAAILANETVSQQALAVADAQDPILWTLRIFLERANPWHEFIEAPDNQTAESTPIVNVALDNWSLDGRASNVVERQKVTAVYNIDCYGYGKSQDTFAGGHEPGDQVAAEECHRAIRLVRNILMSADYTYLLMRGTVWQRWIDSVTMFQPQIDGQNVQQVIAGRIAFRVSFNELSPQIPTETLEYVANTIKRKETGQVYVVSSYDYAP